MDIEEVVTYIAYNATIKSIGRLSCVNKFYYKIFNNYYFWQQKSIFDNFVIDIPYSLEDWKDMYIIFYLNKTCAHKYKNGIRCDNMKMAAFYCKTCNERRCPYMFKITSNVICNNVCDNIGEYCEVCQRRTCKYVITRGPNKGNKCENICEIGANYCGPCKTR
jgi:hypothetical protein